MIAWFKALKFGQNYQDKAEEAGGMTARVLNKRGTPTMGGVLIVLAMDLSALFWTQLNEFVVLTLLSLVLLARAGLLRRLREDHPAEQPRGEIARKLVGANGACAVHRAVSLAAARHTSSLITDIMVPFCKYPVLRARRVSGLLPDRPDDCGQLQCGEFDRWAGWTWPSVAR